MRLLPLGLLACADPPPTVDFGDPDALGPLEPVNLAPEVEPLPGDPFPEQLAFASGEDEANDRYWAHARGWVHAGCGRVWEALRVPEVMLDRRGVDEWTVTEGVRPEFDFSYAFDNVVHAFLTVEFQLTWVHQLQGGAVDQPERVMLRFDKTEGTGFIEILSGSIALSDVDDGLCGLEMIEHMRAAQRDESTLVQYLADVHAEIVATVNGQPLPDYPED